MSRGRRARSQRVYEALLVAYPHGFRREYGPRMAQLFGDLCREERGTYGVVKLWMRTLPDLMVSMVSERSRAMGSGLVRAAGFVTLRNLMLLNAMVLLACGFALTMAAPPMSDLYDLSAAFSDEDPRSTVGNADLAIVRFLGVVSLGFGALLWATSRVADVYIPRAVSGALFGTNALGSFLLLIQHTQIWVNTAGWITVAVHLFFAAAYGTFWLRGSLASAPVGGRTPTPNKRRELLG